MAKLLNGSTVGSNLIWHGGNHGVGSGLDADKLKGVNWTVKSVAPTSPATNDVWVDTKDFLIKVWNGTAWKVYSGDFTGLETTANADAKLANKVDKVAGKQLSTEDFTSTEKTKLSGIATGANNYVHPTGAGNNHIPTGGASGQYLKYSASGTAVWATPTSADITDSATKRFVTDTKITEWDAKETVAGSEFKANEAYQNARSFTVLNSQTTVGIPQMLQTTDKTTAVNAINEVNTKVKEILEGTNGKGLSTNDYTTTEKTKLSGIATGANNYTHPTTAGNKHIPTGGDVGQVLKHGGISGTAIWGTLSANDVNAYTKNETDNKIEGKIDKTSINEPNGVVGIDELGYIPSTLIYDRVEGQPMVDTLEALSQHVYGNDFNATNNNQGHVYLTENIDEVRDYFTMPPKAIKQLLANKLSNSTPKVLNQLTVEGSAPIIEMNETDTGKKFFIVSDGGNYLSIREDSTGNSAYPLKVGAGKGFVYEKEIATVPTLLSKVNMSGSNLINFSVVGTQDFKKHRIVLRNVTMSASSAVRVSSHGNLANGLFYSVRHQGTSGTVSSNALADMISLTTSQGFNAVFEIDNADVIALTGFANVYNTNNISVYTASYYFHGTEIAMRGPNAYYMIWNPTGTTVFTGGEAELWGWN